MKLIRQQSAAAQLYKQWKGLALGSDQHVLGVYGQSSSWTLGYNLFADEWLGTNLVDSSVGVVPVDLVQFLMNFRYSMLTAVSSTISRRLRTLANLACLLTIFLQTQLLQYLVSTFVG